MKSQVNNTKPLFFVVAIIAIAIGVFVQTGKKTASAPSNLVKGILLPNTKPLGDVAFTDHNGQPFGTKELLGKWSILFFGFTNCPDICPTTMHTMKQVKEKVQKAGEWQNFQVVMVSVDPERDTNERLKDYVPYFDPEFIGLSASIEHTTEFAKNLGILFIKDEPAADGNYDVDHGAALILVNPQGQYSGLFSGPHKAEEISRDLITLAQSGYQANESLASTTVPVPTQDKQSSLTFSNAWIRPAPPGANSMSAYFNLRNDTKQEIVIVDAQSEAFNMTMIHETVIEDDIASMNHLDNLTIPSGGSITLAPLGKHMMLVGPKTPLSEGDSATVTLIDKNGQHYSVSIEVKQNS